MNKKNKKLLVYIVGAVAVVGLVFYVSTGEDNGGTVASYSAGSISSGENSFDFGTVPINGGDVTYDFTAVNEGEEAVTISKIYTTCGCTTALIIDSSGKEYGRFGMPGHGLLETTDIRVGPGESVAVRMIFDPAAHGPSGVGLAQRSVYLETNSAVSPKLEFKFQALVTP